MRTARTLAAAAAIAAMIPATALADEVSSPPQQLADVSLAMAEVTETDDEAVFSFEWFVDENGPVLTKADVTGATSTNLRSESSTTAALLAALAQVVEVDYVVCIVTAEGRFASSRAAGTTVTRHLNDVRWRSSCQQFDEDGAVIDVDSDDEDAPPCVWQDATGYGSITDAGLWSPGNVQHGDVDGTDDGCGIDLRLARPLPVGILEDDTNVHGTGSSLSFFSFVGLVIDGVGDWEFCLTGTGRQDLDLTVDHTC